MRQDVWSKKSWEAPETDKQPHSPTVFDNAQAKTLQDKNLRYKGVDKSGESDIIKNKKCEIVSDKINKFFLKPQAKHSKEFFDVGYKENDFELLEKDLLDCFDYQKAVDKIVLYDGAERFSIFVELGVNKKKRFRTVWQKDAPDSIPRIITAHREDE